MHVKTSDVRFEKGAIHSLNLLNRFFLEPVLAVAASYKYNDLWRVSPHINYLIWHYFGRFRKVVFFSLQTEKNNNNDNDSDDNNENSNDNGNFLITASNFCPY